MKVSFLAMVVVALLSTPALGAPAQRLPHPAIFTDPPADKDNPARMEVLHIPTGGVEINGVAYVASGAGVHPTVVLFHGWPGNEKNLDLAQAIRRDGWTVVTLNYRGSWGSPGSFSFAGNLDDAKAALAYVREPANAVRLGVDTKRIVVMGHSMGGWVTAVTAGRDPDLLGAVLISAADMASMRGAAPEVRLKQAAGNMESLAGVTPQSVADQIAALSAKDGFTAVTPGLARKPLLVLSADDGLAGSTDRLVQAIHEAGGQKVQNIHVATDHSWSGARVRLESEILTWLDRLK